MKIRGNPMWLWVFVICVRAPILLPFYVLAKVGEWAEDTGSYVSSNLPGLNRQKQQGRTNS